MKLRLFLFCSLLLSLSLNFIYCQQITFQKIYLGAPNFVDASRFEIIQTQDKGYMYGNLIKLMKTDSLGNLQWMKKFNNGPVSEGFYSIASLHDGGFAAGGSTFLLKLDSNYSISWAKDFINLNGTLFYAIRETNDHGFILGGMTAAFYQHGYTTIVIKADSSGIVEWTHLYKINLGFALEFLSLPHDGGYILSGISPSIYDSINNTDIAVLKIDSVGNPIWGKRYSSNPSNSFFNHISAISDGGYILTGARNLYRYLLKIDSVGNKQWMKEYDSELVGSAKWVEQTSDGGFIVTGDQGGIDSSALLTTAFLMKTDSAGDLLWARELGGYGDLWASCVKQTEDGGYAIAARQSGTANSDDMSIIKTDSLGHTNGCLEGIPIVTVFDLNDTVINEPVTDSAITIITVNTIVNPPNIGSVITRCAPVGIDEAQKEKAEIEIYPNPSNGFFSVSSSLHPIQTIRISDLSGKIIFSKDKISKNSYECKLNAPDGIYIAEVFCKEKVYRRKIVFLN